MSFFYLIGSKNDIFHTNIFKCRNCGANTRVPRYLNAKKIDQQSFISRNDSVFLFLSILRSVNIESRIVIIPQKQQLYFLEFWSEKHKKFMHLDPFQCAYDCPLIYERAWKQKVCYAIAVGEFSCTNVTPKYTSSGLKDVDSKVYADIIKIKNLMYMTFASEKERKEIDQKIQCDNESTATYKSEISEFEKEKKRESIVY